MGPLKLPQYTGFNKYIRYVAASFLDDPLDVVLTSAGRDQGICMNQHEPAHPFIYQSILIMFIQALPIVLPWTWAESIHSITSAAEERVTRTFFRAMMRVRRGPSLKNAEALRLIPEIHREPPSFSSYPQYLG